MFFIGCCNSIFMLYFQNPFASMRDILLGKTFENQKSSVLFFLFHLLD